MKDARGGKDGRAVEGGGIAGYLLIECIGRNIAAPKLFYSRVSLALLFRSIRPMPSNSRNSSAALSLPQSSMAIASSYVKQRNTRPLSSSQPLRADSPTRSSSRPYSTFASSGTPL